MARICYVPGKEMGLWFEVLAIRRNIDIQESRGRSSAKEREILTAWMKMPEYRAADAENDKEGRYNGLSASARAAGLPASTPQHDKTLPRKPVTLQEKSAVNYETSKRRGRPVKTGPVSRVTAWRREKSSQLVMI